MSRFWEVLQVAAPVIVIVLCGVLIRSRTLVTSDGIDQIKAVLVNICLPAVLFRTFYAMRFSWKEGVVFAALAGATLIAFLLGFAAARLLRAKARITPWLCTTIEGGSIGYALYILLFGQKNLYHLALLDAGNALIQWSLVMTLLAMRTDEKKPLRETLRSVVTPVNAAIAAGLFCSVTGLGRIVSSTSFGQVLEAVLDFVGTPVSAMIMMTVGYDLSLKDVQWGETVKAAAARALIFGLLGLLVYKLVGQIFPEDPLYGSAAMIFFILPPTYAYTVFIKDPKESSFLGGFLAVYTLLTIVGFTLLTSLMG